MDFPSPLRPAFFMTGPLGMTDIPDLSFMCSWRDALTLPESPLPCSKGGALPPAQDLLWEPALPGPVPLLPPGPDPWDPGLTARDLLFRGANPYRRQPRAVLDITEQLSHFLWDHGDVAFTPLGKLMLENFKLEGNRSRSKKVTVVSVKNLVRDLSGHQPWGCPWAYLTHRQRRFSILGGPVLSRTVSSLLGRLLREELALKWEQLMLDEAFTGGALAWLPGRTVGTGQLVYPTGGALDRLYLHEVSLASAGDPQVLGDPGCIQLRGPVRQVVTSTVQGETLLAVRSDYHCAVWKVGRQGRPAPLQVVQVEKGATGVSLSPHLPGELAVCSRSGAVCLWTPQDGLQQIYKDSDTLVFRDLSPWRWADFTAHPRVLTVGDRTGVKMIDTQAPPGCGLMLFRGGAEASCQKGERVLLVQYLGQTDGGSLPPTLHLVCTQFSLYLVDERLPLVPMMKWDHGLASPPLLARLLPPPGPSCPQPLLLGGQGGQLQLLHITGDGTSPPRLAAHPQSLPSCTDSLSAFPLLEPKSHQQLQERLEAPTIGLSATIPPPCGSTPILSVFQLSAAGDIFYQHLRLQTACSLRDEGPPGSPGPHRLPAGAASHPQDHAPTPSWDAQATAHCSRWMEALLQVPRVPRTWTAPTFSHRHLLGRLELQQSAGKTTERLRAAMAEGRLLRRGDLGPLPAAEPPPAPQPGPQDQLTERLGEAWEGRGAAWWGRQQDKVSGPKKQAKRAKRRTQLSSTFSQSSCIDHPDSPGGPTPSPSEAAPRPPVTPPSQASLSGPWLPRAPLERRQRLRDQVARLPPEDTPKQATVPLSQQTPGLTSSQPPRKKPRMGF
ncbi:PREDICTED: TATA box-binding protein-associated factor RNA polymerase I subunit C [Dipodomys ordii]|uniref:TATA box-binding protein-associated factor RNA polymerase I subunit C n=1 Tax=Dipodomys ordii TaxID=10020 RepID=A0A1S3EXB7_DIPOR|nr:PREDICTED: TATA box-binding protein-associated factor RNA polymerase I subunit C [Dipodomys ordii]